MLLHCKTGHIGLAAYLHRFGRHPTPSCPFCGNGPHTVEHLFIHCTGRDCTGHEMAQRRATLFARTEGTTNLGAIFTEFPREAVKFAFKTFGIPQFTRANWKIKAARKRGRHRAPRQTTGRTAPRERGGRSTHCRTWGGGTTVRPRPRRPPNKPDDSRPIRRSRPPPPPR